MVLIVRFMHVHQVPSGGDAKGLRYLFKVRQSRAICRGCRRAPEDTHSLLESGCVESMRDGRQQQQQQQHKNWKFLFHYF